MDYKQKYLKYKTKYLDLKGGKHRFKVEDMVTYKDGTIPTMIYRVLSDGMNYQIRQDNRELDVPEDDLTGKCPFKVGDLVYVKKQLRVFEIKGQLRGLSSDEIESKPAEIEVKDAGIDIPANDEVTVLKVLFKDSLIPLVEKTPQKNCYRIKVKHRTSELIINSTNIRSRNILEIVPSDVYCEIGKFQTWKELIELSKTNPNVARDLRICPLDLYDQDRMTFAIFQNSFPNAIGLNFSFDTLLRDADFISFEVNEAIGRYRRIKRLDIGFCRQITDAAFKYLEGIHTLNMMNCWQITDDAFRCLIGIHTLNMSSCTQITDAAFSHLKGIKTLVMASCTQITNEAFIHLEGIHELNIYKCSQITNEAFKYLKGIQKLRITDCNQITDDAFKHLKGIKELDMPRFNQVGITNRAFSYLEGIHKLDMSRCNQDGITNEAFSYLKGIHTLYMSNCTQITDAAFSYLTGIHTLNMANCNQITREGLIHLKGITKLGMMGCRPGLIDEAKGLGLNIVPYF